MSWILFMFLSVYILITAVWGYRRFKTLKEDEVNEAVKLKIYKESVIEGWILTAVLLLITSLARIPITNIGLKHLELGFMDYSLWIKVTTFVLCGILMVLLLYQMVGYLFSKAYRIKLEQQLTAMAEKNKHYDTILDIMIPKTPLEKRWFALTSLTAGIGEELVYRGFMTYLLFDLFPEAGVFLILIATGLIFGIAHAYQGAQGMLKTALMGILFGALYYASGSLIPGMVLHFISDFSSCFLHDPRQQQAAD